MDLESCKYLGDPGICGKCHSRLPGKIKRVEDVGRLEPAFAVAKETDEHKRRAGAYKAFIQPSKPER